MENKEAVNQEDRLNRALEPEFTDRGRYESLMEIAQDFLRDKLFYLGCAKIYKEAGDDVTAENYELRAENVDKLYLDPLGKILGTIKLPISWPMEPEDVEEIRKYFGDEYFNFEEEEDEEWEEE